MKFKPGQHVIFKNYQAVVEFYYPNYKNGEDAYTIVFERKGNYIHRLCLYSQLKLPDQISFFD